MLPTWLWISLGVYALYAIGMIFLLRSIVKGGLRYLYCPPANFMHSCSAAARYDAMYLNLTEMILTALFITPIRIAVLITFVLITTILMAFFKLLFWGNLHSFSFCQKQPNTSRQDLCLAHLENLHLHEVHLVGVRFQLDQVYQTQNKRCLC